MAGRCRTVRARETGKAEGVAGPTLVGERRKPLTPGQCRAHMRRRLADEFEGIVSGFIESAKAGSCQHVKLATELLEPRRRQAKKSDGRGTLQRWLEEVERPE